MSCLRVAFFVYELMKTIIYIDHFNFYYGLLKSTSYKWLDYYKLFIEEVMPNCPQPSTNLSIKFFSSDIKASFHVRGASASEAQQKFFRALEHYLGDNVTIIKGKYSTSPTGAYPYDQSSPKKPHTFDKHRVWKIEEKLTDVALSLHAYRDVAKGHCEQVVICSNDSDISPALKLIKEDFPEVKVGIVYPIKSEIMQGRRTSAALDEYSDWTVNSISEDSLSRSQMPNRVQTGKKPIDKPEHW